jgi:hypothetical protein
MGSRGRGSGKLVRKALEYLRKQRTRARHGQRRGMTPERLRHTMFGERGDRPGGFHHRPGGQNPPGARVIRVTRRDPRTGVYEARVAMQDRSTGQWHEKTRISTFFPDDWTPEQVDNAVTGAFAKAVKDPETGTWTGRYRGITIQGFYDPITNTVRHGFPTLPSGGTR